MLNFFRTRSGSFKNDILSGLTVALALVPEAIAFAFVAHLSPLIGLYSAFFIGLICAIMGGRPGMISGATGAMAVVVVALVLQHGVAYLFPTVILCGIFQIAIGVGRLGKLIRMVPHSVMLGFVNGLAIVIGMAQLESFKTISDSGDLVFISGWPLALMLLLVALTMGIIWLLPKVTQAVPASLAAIVTISLIAIGINQYSGSATTVAGSTPQVATNTVATVGDMLQTNALAAKSGSHSHHGSEASDQLDDPANMANESTVAVPVAAAHTGAEAASTGISGGLPKLFFLDDQYETVPLNWATLMIILPYAFVLCGVGLIESLMTLTLIDEITNTRGDGNRECVGQGAANLVCGLFGGMGGCAMIGQSLINVNSGGRGRLSGITAAVCLLLFILFLSPVIEQIPMAALVGVMFMVVIGTFEWASLKMFRRMPKTDIAVMILVAGYTVFMHNLAAAVILGVIVSALVFAWQHSTHIGADISHNEFGSKIYQLHGPLFFASVTSFKEMFSPENDPDDVVVDFYFTRVYDQSALEAINVLADKYEAAGKRLHLRHLSPECQAMLNKAGDMVDVNVSTEPHFHVETDRELQVAGKGNMVSRKKSEAAHTKLGA